MASNKGTEAIECLTDRVILREVKWFGGSVCLHVNIRECLVYWA